jgi:signal transduction histidine kinase/CheY-like chemotaxis protein
VAHAARNVPGLRASPDRPAARGIGYYLIALILLAVVPLVVISAVLVWRQSALQQEISEKSLQQTSLALVVAVDRQLGTYRTMLETLAESDSLAHDDLKTFQLFCTRAASRHGAIFISFFDRDGRQLFNTLRTPGESLPTPFRDPRAQVEGTSRPPIGDPTYLRMAFETARPNVSDLTYGLVAGRLIFVVNLPISRDGKVRYVLNAAFDPEVMTRLLRENPTFRGVPAVIFDRKGFIVGRWENADQFVGKRVRSYERMQDADMGTGSGETLEGHKVYFSYARSPVSGWGVNVGAERDAIEKTVHTIWAVGLALAAVGLIVGVLLAVSLASRLRRSIVGLARSASRNERPAVTGLRTVELMQLEDALVASQLARNAEARERESRLVAEARKSEAEEANRMKDRFIALLSHELRNPLAPIRTSVHLLRALEAKPGASTKDVVDMLDRQSLQLTRLVNDLLDVSRIGAGRLSLELARIDLGAVARHALETAGPAIQARGHRLTSAIPPQPVEVMGDFARLSQLVSNLLDNAAKFTAAGGEITLSLQTQGESAVLAVKDSGRGIDAMALREIFLPFVQSQKKPMHAGDTGLGLGLALARSVAELHHGTLAAHSEGVGRGALFLLRLPLAGAQAAAAGKPGRAGSPQPAHCRVLVVDDNLDAGESLGAVLRSMGCESLVIDAGEQVLRAARDWRPDVVLLDIGMPGKDGYEVARELRAARLEPMPVLVALTGWGQDVDKERTRAAGFDLHLVKPVELEDLERALALKGNQRLSRDNE